MANNRMYLVNKRTGYKVHIAKYYPSTGWYCKEGIEDTLNTAFHNADFGSCVGVSNAGMYGDEWDIEYQANTQ